jgi:hypothetical protein
MKPPCFANAKHNNNKINYMGVPSYHINQFYYDENPGKA